MEQVIEHLETERCGHMNQRVADDDNVPKELPPFSDLEIPVHHYPSADFIGPLILPKNDLPEPKMVTDVDDPHFPGWSVTEGASTPFFDPIETFCEEIDLIRSVITPWGISLGSELIVSLGLHLHL